MFLNIGSTNKIWKSPLNEITNIKFIDMIKNKSLRIHIRVTPETKSAWIRSCEMLPGKTQSQVFRNLVDKLSDMTNTVNESGKVITQ